MGSHWGSHSPAVIADAANGQCVLRFAAHHATGLHHGFHGGLWIHARKSRGNVIGNPLGEAGKISEITDARHCSSSSCGR